MKKILVVFLSILIGCFSFCFFACSNSNNTNNNSNSTNNNSNNINNSSNNTNNNSNSTNSDVVECLSIEITEKNLELSIGETKTLVVIFSPNNTTNKEITFSSSDKNVVSVDSKGKITALSVGTSSITASTSNGCISYCVVNVIQKVGTVKGNVTYKYNNYIGYKADVDAKVFLIPKNTKESSIDYSLIYLGFDFDMPSTILKTTVDGNGDYIFNNVPIGEYIVLIRSRNSNSNISAGYTQLAYIYLYDYFKDDNNYINKDRIEEKISCKEIVVENGQVVTFSESFGITYI